ncbi:MAG: hypothetical protein WA635_11625 [Gallionella sp.]
MLLFTGIAAPIAGVLFRHVAGGWDSIGKGPFAIDPDLPQGRPLELVSPVDPAIQAAEARQMIEAKSYRRSQRGEAPIDIEAEVRLALDAAPSRPTLTGELRAEVRGMAIARNERRMCRGEEPLDVDAEIERQLSDFIGCE